MVSEGGDDGCNDTIIAQKSAIDTAITIFVWKAHMFLSKGLRNSQSTLHSSKFVIK